MSKKLKSINRIELLETKLVSLEKDFNYALKDKSSNLTSFLSRIQEINKLLDTLFPEETLGKKIPLQQTRVQELANVKRRETPISVRQNVQNIIRQEPQPQTKYSQPSTSVRPAGYGQKTSEPVVVSSLPAPSSLEKQVIEVLKLIEQKKKAIKNYHGHELTNTRESLQQNRKKLENLIKEAEIILEKGQPKRSNRNALESFKNARLAVRLLRQ